MHPLSKLFSAALLLTLAHLAPAQQVTAVQNLDPNRFVGTWHEIARYPYKREKNCVGNTVLLVALADKPNQLQLVTSCNDKKGYTDITHSTARGPKPKPGRTLTTGEYKVTTLFPFSTRLWLLALADDNTWAIVGSPDHHHLWLYAKTPTLPPATLQHLQSLSTGQGYDISKLAMTPLNKMNAPASQ